jgi:DDE superfamily endonuclease
MPPLKTRLATEVYTEAPPPDHVPSFVEREIDKIDSFDQQRVKGRHYLPKEDVRVLIRNLIETSVRDSKRARRLRDLETSDKTPRLKLTRKQQVNRKRRLITACIQNQQIVNLKQVARHTRSCYKTVRRVYCDLQNERDSSTYEYNNLKSDLEMQALEADVQAADGGLVSVADLKRQNPTFSRKKILEVLHSKQMRWRKLPLAEPKFLTYDPPNQKDVNRIICNMAVVHSNPETQMLFVDEMKFPLQQTAKYHWIHKERESAIKLNRREVSDTTITAIAMCSHQKFVAVQLFNGEIKGQDFLNFINVAISRLPLDKHYLILADNATWHNSGAIQKTEAYKFLFFNLPRMFQINLIENAFSAVRSEYRKRPTVDSLIEEAKNIVNLFFVRENVERFEGYWRNHLRMLDKYYK